MKRNLCLAFALVLPLTLYAESGNAPTVKKDTLVPKKEAAAVPDSIARKYLGRLSIVSTPPQAEVNVDSIPKGVSPVVVDSLAPGTHVIIVKAMGYFGKKVIVDVPADTTVDLAVTLVAPAHLVVMSDPPGAAALMDGKQIGTTPCDNPGIKPGTHALKFSKAGYFTLEKQVALTEGKTDTVSVMLRPVPQTGAALKQPVAPPKKTGFDRVAALAAAGAFVVFAAILLGVELHEAGK
jgi:hypothetical protein